MTRSGFHLRVGEAGEELAARFLEGKGLRIVGRRVRCGKGELDIVAREGREWVFVEVKTRRSARMGTAAEALTPRKTARMFRAVEEYVAAHDLDEMPIRLDLIAIDYNADGVPEVTHYPGGVEMG